MPDATAGQSCVSRHGALACRRVLADAGIDYWKTGHALGSRGWPDQRVILGQLRSSSPTTMSNSVNSGRISPRHAKIDFVGKVEYCWHRKVIDKIRRVVPVWHKKIRHLAWVGRKHDRMLPPGCAIAGDQLAGGATGMLVSDCWQSLLCMTSRGVHVVTESAI